MQACCLADFSAMQSSLVVPPLCASHLLLPLLLLPAPSSPQSAFSPFSLLGSFFSSSPPWAKVVPAPRQRKPQVMLQLPKRELTSPSTENILPTPPPPPSQGSHFQRIPGDPLEFTLHLSPPSKFPRLSDFSILPNRPHLWHLVPIRDRQCHGPLRLSGSPRLQTSPAASKPPPHPQHCHLAPPAQSSPCSPTPWRMWRWSTPATPSRRSPPRSLSRPASPPSRAGSPYRDQTPRTFPSYP